VEVMMARAILLVLAIFLGACATTTIGAVRAPSGTCTRQCWTATSGHDARVACLRTCPGATVSGSSCPTPPAPATMCLNTRTEHRDPIVDAALAEFFIGILTAPVR
jgi:hypothetical protein